MSNPTIKDFRSALVQLIVTKDQINAATTQLISEMDRAAMALEQIAKDMDDEESTDES
jgi:hypothetical protein